MSKKIIPFLILPLCVGAILVTEGKAVPSEDPYADSLYQGTYGSYQGPYNYDSSYNPSSPYGYGTYDTSRYPINPQGFQSGATFSGPQPSGIDRTPTLPGSPTPPPTPPPTTTPPMGQPPPTPTPTPTPQPTIHPTGPSSDIIKPREPRLDQTHR